MTSFIIGLSILLIGWLFYSKYVEGQFEPDKNTTPAEKINDGVDFIPLSKKRNLLIHLLNIAGLGPILGAIQGILFGPVAFILIPLGCIFMGGVHDYFAGMMSVKNDGAQITELIKKYCGKNMFFVFMVIVSIMLLLLASVFIYTSGDLIAQRFFSQSDFSLSNPVIIIIYAVLALYYISATMFPVDKIIGRFYPFFGALLILGTALIVVGFFTRGIELQNIDFGHINKNPSGLHILPVFFMTVSCGLLSGFHSTQATIISRTLKSEYDGKSVFYGMMCLESLIAMIWAAGAMHVYSLNLVPENIIGTANTINTVADVFAPHILTFLITLAVIILPITSGDTALRGLRITMADAVKLPQKSIKNRLLIIVPIIVIVCMTVIWAKSNSGSFSLIWRYFNFVNQLITIPVFMFATIFLFKKGKNYLITLLPGLFYVYITTSFIFNAKIGFNLGYQISQIIGLIACIICLVFMIKKLKNSTL